MPRVSKKVKVYQTVNTTTQICLYDYDLRKLLKLPLRKGSITGATFEHGRLDIEFATNRGSYFKI